MTAEPTRLVPRWRELVRIGPYANDHWAALRVGLANAGPFLLLWSIGRLDLSLYAVFAAFTSVYARNLAHSSRLRLQSIAGLSLLASIAAGALISLAPARTLAIVPVAAVWAAGASLLGDTMRWTPPGPLFQIFGLAAVAAVPGTPAHVGQGLLTALATVAWALLIGYGGRVIRRLSKHERIRSPSRSRPALPPPADGRLRNALRFGTGTFVAGAIPTVIGIGHPYWAMVSVIAALSAASAAHRIVRAVHRLAGTLLGLALGGLILVFHPSALGVVMVVIALSAAIELFVLRNYSLAMTFMTPMVLLMGELAGHIDEGRLLFERGLETLIGVVVAVALVLVRARWAARGGRGALPVASEE